MPTNTQFVERGVKESGFVTLGRRNETNRSILAISRATIIPEGLLKGRQEINHENIENNDEKEHQLKGKKKTFYLMQSLKKHLLDVEEMEFNNPTIDYKVKRKELEVALTSNHHQFKRKRIDAKVQRIKDSFLDEVDLNVYERRTGETDTPFIQGRIQYGKLRAAKNQAAIRAELTERQVSIPARIGWMAMINLLKEDERRRHGQTNDYDDRFFVPLKEYDSFETED